VPLEDGEKRHMEYDVHRLIAARDAKFTNFVEVNDLLSMQPDAMPCKSKQILRIGHAILPSALPAVAWCLGSKCSHRC
jgi:hypothetical protein